MPAINGIKPKPKVGMVIIVKILATNAAAKKTTIALKTRFRHGVYVLSRMFVKILANVAMFSFVFVESFISAIVFWVKITICSNSSNSLAVRLGVSSAVLIWAIKFFAGSCK